MKTLKLLCFKILKSLLCNLKQTAERLQSGLCWIIEWLVSSWLISLINYIFSALHAALASCHNVMSPLPPPLFTVCLSLSLTICFSLPSCCLTFPQCCTPSQYETLKHHWGNQSWPVIIFNKIIRLSRILFHHCYLYCACYSILWAQLHCDITV